MHQKVILIVGLGTSPAVLTQTVWALVHKKEYVLPDEIVVLTTKSGKKKLCEEILLGDSSVWNGLIKALKNEGYDLEDKLLLGETSIRVVPDEKGNEIDDLRTGEDNLRAADFMLRQIRQYTESFDTVLYTSIAGGRKTMSALLFSCMTLLGREQDKILHVLQAPQFEGRIDAPLYGDGEIFEVPFVRMRGWYQEKFKTIPPTYRTLISKVQTIAPPAVAYPEIVIDAYNGGVALNGNNISMSKPCFALLVLLASGCETKTLHKRLLLAHASKSASKCDWLSTFTEGSLFSRAEDTEDLNKTMSNLRKKLKGAGFDNPESLVPQRGAPVMFPISKIKWQNRKRLADICGYLISHDDDGDLI